MSVTIVLLLVAIGAGVVVKVRRKSQVSPCVDNLRRLGMAASLYEKSNNGELPYAFILYADQRQISWDTLLLPMVQTVLREGRMSEPPPPRKVANRLLLCPEDTLGVPDWALKRGYDKRTYAMSDHDMQPENWPPGPDNATGVGLHWSFGSKGERPPSDRIYNYSKTNEQAAVKLELILSPAATMLLTERVRSANVAGNSAGAVISSTADHIQSEHIQTNRYHQGRMNYLMMDGHVETLYPFQTVGARGSVGNQPKTHRGMWTIRKDD